MTRAIEVRGLKKSYATSSRFWQRREHYRALDGIDLTVERGEIVGLVGRNGYGKTTLIKCVAGLLAPSEGEVRVWTYDSQKQPSEVRRLIGWVGAEERSFYLRLTGLQNLMFFARLQGMTAELAGERIGHFCSLLKCDALLNKRVHEHSTGNRQRFSIVRGLLHDPKVLILDEPTRSLDPFSASDLCKILRQWVEENRERCILVTSHQLDEVEDLSDRIAIMGKGKMGAFGTLAELRSAFQGGETVQVVVREALQKEVLDELTCDLREFTYTCSVDAQVLSFRRDPNDDRLQWALARLIEHGAVIESVSSQAVPLQDLIDRFENIQPVAAVSRSYAEGEDQR